MNAVADAWATLEREDRREQGWHVRRVYPAASCQMLAGLHQPDGIPGLLLEVPVDQVPPELALPRSNGFVVEPVLLGGSHSGRVRFALALTEPSYQVVFTVLCEDVAIAAAEAPSSRSALRDWTGRLHVWQAFMARHGAGGLSETAELGLLGELLVIRDELTPRVGLAGALDIWTGPRGEPNDFALSGGFLEIKTTSRQAPEFLDIANADQLDERRGRILVGHLRMRPDADGMTLPLLASEVRSLLARDAPNRLVDFEDLLMAVGYVEAQADLYTRAYRHDRTDLFDVTGDFPRLARSELRAGIRSCSYTIELAACAPFAVVPALLDEMVGGVAIG